MNHRRVIFIRHGQTDWNAQGRWQGHADIPLNSTGRDEAERTAEVLRDLEFGACLTSDLSRARETAEIVLRGRGIEVDLDPRLREVHAGEAEGKTFHEVVGRFGADSVERWRDLFDTRFRFPGGESKTDSLERARQGLEEFLSRRSCPTVAVVFHSLVMRVLLHSLLPDLQHPIPIPNCCCYRLDHDGETSEWEARGDLCSYLSIEKAV